MSTQIKIKSKLFEIGSTTTIATHIRGTLNVTRLILSEVSSSSSLNFADDAAGGVDLGEQYHTSGSIKIRLIKPTLNL